MPVSSAVPKILLVASIAVVAMLGFLFGRADPCLASAYLGDFTCGNVRGPLDHGVTVLLLLAVSAVPGHLAARWFGERAFVIAPLALAVAWLIAFLAQQLAPHRGLLEYYAVYGWGDALHEISVIVLAGCVAVSASLAAAWITLKLQARR